MAPFNKMIYKHYQAPNNLWFVQRQNSRGGLIGPIWGGFTKEVMASHFAMLLNDGLFDEAKALLKNMLQGTKEGQNLLDSVKSLNKTKMIQAK